MKKFASIFIFFLSLLIAFNGYSQMSKEDAKTWKKRTKALTPEQYKDLVDENKSLKGQVSSLKTELSGIDQSTAEKDDQIAQYQQQLSDMRSQLAQAKAESQRASQNSNQNSRGANINDQVGIVFKVQIGAFRNKDLSKFLDAGENFSGETGDQGLKQYTLGVFRDYWEADTFKKYLREMGVKDAWIVSYKDGNRVPIKDVLESVPKS
ncbi:MAG: Ezrin/radixin/moesin family protein [Cyclobacteriaceae bacterium]|nr:Ezrin/radixin/moesin family protein [Cyclobacteriaceae bacterium]